MKNVLPFLGIH